jgi:hypothetical protein
MIKPYEHYFLPRAQLLQLPQQSPLPLLCGLLPLAHLLEDALEVGLHPLVLLLAHAAPLRRLVLPVAVLDLVLFADPLR